MFPAKALHQAGIVAIKLPVTGVLFYQRIIIPAAEEDMTGKFNGFQDIFNVLIHNIGCGVWFDVH
jgi:hypothetical protein